MKIGTLIAVFVTCLRLCAADGQLTPDERAKALKYLEDSQKEFLGYLDGVNEEQWKWKPSPERWSVGETAEHIVLAERFLFAGAQKALATQPDPDWAAKTKGKAELLERVMVDRSRKVQAPEPVRPDGPLMAKQDVIAQFRQERARTIEFVKTTDQPLKEHLAKGPFPVFDPLNAYQFILYIPLHNLRHDQQIAEVKATPGYPK